MDSCKVYEALAREQRVVRLMVMHIECDKDFYELLGKTRLNGLSKAEKWIDEVRSKVDEHYSRNIKSAGPDLFYGGFQKDLIEQTANEVFCRLKDGGDNSEQE